MAELNEVAKGLFERLSENLEFRFGGEQDTREDEGVTSEDATGVDAESDADELDADAGNEPEDEGEPDEADDEEADDEESEEGEETEPELPAASLFTVRVDGKDVQVSQDELLAGYSRQADYTRKTQALAEERKALTKEIEDARAERQEYGERLQVLAQQLASTVPAEPETDDPKAWVNYQRKKQQFEQVREEQRKLQERLQADLERQRNDILAREYERLVEAIPEWKDEQVRAQGQKSLATYATSLGFTNDELDSVIDHRVVLMLRKAMLFDEQQSKRDEVKVKATKSPTLKPGKPKARKSSGKKQVDKLRQRLREQGSERDAIQLLETYTELD